MYTSRGTRSCVAIIAFCSVSLITLRTTRPTTLSSCDAPGCRMLIFETRRIFSRKTEPNVARLCTPVGATRSVKGPLWTSSSDPQDVIFVVIFIFIFFYTCWCYIYTYIYTYRYLHVYLYLYSYSCLYVHLCYIYIYIYIYIHVIFMFIVYLYLYLHLYVYFYL